MNSLLQQEQKKYLDALIAQRNVAVSIAINGAKQSIVEKCGELDTELNTKIAELKTQYSGAKVALEKRAIDDVKATSGAEFDAEIDSLKLKLGIVG